MAREPFDLGSLLKSTQTNTILEEEHIVVLMYNALLSLTHLHGNGIVHRDIKPANLLVDNACSVKLCDFGLSRSTLEGPCMSTADKSFEKDDDSLTSWSHIRSIYSAEINKLVEEDESM